MGKALYRKYRSKLLSEVIGQDHIVSTLTNALKNDQISHAYLLTGPRGVGKTSVARILAHEINKLPYTDDSQHLDIIEIDAASNRRIDEIRDLREKSRLAPTSAKYKVYIIDEVHMLTKEAFNALLKTLEEPPAHVVFILATTELHKLPATIISRTQRFAFRPIHENDMVKHLRNISDLENINISDDAINLISHHANGGFRDAISLLDQIRSSSETIGLDEVESILGRPASTHIRELLEIILNGSHQDVFIKLEKLYSEGYSASIITEALLAESQKALRESQNSSLLNLIESLLKVEISTNKNIALEVALIKIAPSQETTSLPKNAPPVTQTKKTTTAKKNTATKDKELEAKDVPQEEIIQNPIDFENVWQSTLDNIKKSHNTLYGILKNASANFIESSNQLALGFRFPFHMKKAGEAKNQEIIKKAFFDQTSRHIELQFIRQEKEKPATKKSVGAVKSSSDSVISTVIGVFGGGEIVGK